jgi:hypothetical protein
LWDLATSLSGREGSIMSSITMARSSNSPPSGRVGRDDRTR